MGRRRSGLDDHLLGRLLSDARRTGAATLRLDILTGAATPEVLVSRSLARTLERYVDGFPDLVAGGHTDMQYIRGARMELTFDLATERPVEGAANLRESPFLCRVEIDDDKGKTWIAELRRLVCAGARRDLRSRCRAPDVIARSTVACYTEAPAPV